MHGEAVVNVTGAGEEFYDAELNRRLLQRIAGDTGGQYLDAADARALPVALARLRGDVSTLQQLTLRDAPALYLAILALALGEWFLRRRWRLP